MTNNPTQVEPVEGLARKLDHAIRLARKASPTAQVLIGVGTADRILAALKSATPASAEVEDLVERATWFRFSESTGEFTGEYCSVKPHDCRGMVPMVRAGTATTMLRSLSTRLAAVEENYRLLEQQMHSTIDTLAGVENELEAVEAERDEAVGLLRFTSTDPCFKVLGSVTQEDVTAFLSRKDAEQ